VAKALSRRDVQPERLARHIGKYFTEFVGEPQKWARLLWNRYEALKHEPIYHYDAQEIAVLADSARVLLLCAIMNRVALADCDKGYLRESSKRGSQVGSAPGRDRAALSSRSHRRFGVRSVLRNRFPTVPGSRFNRQQGKSDTMPPR
jgi:hypothetical protein